MTWCIPSQLATRLKEAFSKGEITIEELYKVPTSKDRYEIFKKFTNKDIAPELTTKFEKAMVSSQNNALLKFLKSSTEITPKIEKDFTQKVNELQEILTDKNPKQLEGLISSKLGLEITAEEFAAISKLVKNIEIAKEKRTENLSGISIEEATARGGLYKYLLSLNPESNLKIATSIWRRGLMLASLKTPLLNVESNTVAGVLNASSRRITNRMLAGANKELIPQYVKEAVAIFDKSGIDITRTFGIAERKILGEAFTAAEGPGKFRKASQFVEDKVFKQLMATPDVAFSAVHFADTADITSTVIVKKLGLKGNEAKIKAREIMKDAMKLNPVTDEGQLVRATSIVEALYNTYQNDSNFSKISMAFRNVLNEASGDLMIGDQIIPFVKTPANVIDMGWDFAGMKLPVELGKLAIATPKMIKGDFKPIQKLIPPLVKTGFGLVAATAISGMLDPDDFVGAYDPQRVNIDQLKGTNYNAIKLRNKWYSLVYLGPLAMPVAGIMYARKYGQKGNWTISYINGIMTQTTDLPGLIQMRNFIDNVVKKKKSNEVKALLTEDLPISLMDYAASFVTPGLMLDTAKGLDKYERDTKGKTPFDTFVNRFESKIPILRGKLPIKRDILAQPIEGEGFISNILAGSRVKTYRGTTAVEELSRLADKGLVTSITDIRKSTGKTIAQFKEKIGDDKFNNEAFLYYGEQLKKNIEKAVSSEEYKQLSDEDKKSILDDADKWAQNDMFDKYNFEYEKEERKELPDILGKTKFKRKKLK